MLKFNYFKILKKLESKKDYNLKLFNREYKKLTFSKNFKITIFSIFLLNMRFLKIINSYKTKN